MGKAFLFTLFVLMLQAAAPARIDVVSPPAGAVYPPDFAPPAFEWRDRSRATQWLIEPADSRVAAGPWRVDGRRLPALPPDPRAVAPTNAPPPDDPSLRQWRPSPSDWSAFVASGRNGLVLRLSGLDRDGRRVSMGEFRFSISGDPVGAPIFYRDVPLMPALGKLGVVSPLPPDAVRLVAWRLRDVSRSESRLLLEGLPTCANCHSFSRDGKTMGIDVDGPDSDKGTYALTAVQRRTSIARTDVMTWNSFPGRTPGQRTIGLLSQVSPDGRFAVSTVNETVYSANFTDYRFLQVFYPTRGILAVYSRDTGRMAALPGADDPRFVHTGATWSPDGQWVLFSRAPAQDAYPAGRPMPRQANDPQELPVRYALFRVPFNGGRGGVAEPVYGADSPGFSHSFPRYTPDGRFIVFVRSRNGQLMRPDSELHILPAQGGAPRRMTCNTERMNSWHSFSPNGRWMVFSSKSRSPYTQMFLTHIDEQGNDTPPVLIENATAPNRAVNLPEFVNLPPGGLESIEVPAAEFYRLYDRASSLAREGNFQQSAAVWRDAVALEPEDPRAHNNLGFVLSRLGRPKEAIESLRRAIALDGEYSDAYLNLGSALWSLGEAQSALDAWERAARLAASPSPALYDLLAGAYVALGRNEDARRAAERSLELAEQLGDTERAVALRARLRSAVPAAPLRNKQ